MVTVSWWTFVAAALKSLPLILQLIGQFKSAADAKANQGIGYDKAVADGLKVMSDQLKAADEAVQAARDKQALHPGSDDGRDTDFRRD
jgi:hypothetical protein